MRKIFPYLGTFQREDLTTSYIIVELVPFVVEFVTKKWPVTAPGSQGVFGA
jgi:hypothetical protein